MLNEDKLESVVIDLTSMKGGELNEDFVRAFGNSVRFFLKALLDDDPINMFKGIIRGTPREVNTFAKTIGSEKRYIEIAKKYGLDDPRTASNRARLMKSIGSFERETGIKWPLK